MARAVRDSSGRYLPTRAPRGGAQTSVVVVPRGTVARRAAGTIARRVGSAAGSAAKRAAESEKHTLTALGTALGLGIARRKGYRLPTIAKLPPAVTIGVLAWAYGKWGKNRTAEHVGTGALSIALYELVAYSKDTREGIDRLVNEQVDIEEREADEDDEDEAEGVGSRRARRYLGRD